jgi:phosphatidylglycerophosphate synthase
VQTVFIETTGDRHLTQIAGLTALERTLRRAAKQGATHAIVAAGPVAFPRPLPITVEFAGPDAAAPTDTPAERADVIAGIELVDAAAARRAEWTLIRTMNKSFQGPVDALFNWRFSMRITRVLARRSLAITPNHVTCVSIVVGLLAGFVATRGGWAALALGALLLQVQSILDSVDGELARLRFQFSKLGQWLDNLSDDVVDNAFIAAVGYALGGPWPWLGFAAAGGRVAFAAATYLWVYLTTGSGDVFAFRWWFESATATADEIYSPRSLATWLRSLGRRDTYVFCWMIACACGLPQWVVVHALVIAAINLSLLALHVTVFRGRRA